MTHILNCCVVRTGVHYELSSYKIKIWLDQNKRYESFTVNSNGNYFVFSSKQDFILKYGYLQTSVQRKVGVYFLLQDSSIKSNGISYIFITHLGWFDDIGLRFKSVLLLEVSGSIISDVNLSRLITFLKKVRFSYRWRTNVWFSTRRDIHSVSDIILNMLISLVEKPMKNKNKISGKIYA